MPKVDDELGRYSANGYKATRFQTEYGDWLARFAAANLWRILITLLEDNEVPVPLLTPATAAESAWRAFIRGEAPDCAPHNLHLIMIDNRPEWAAYAEGAIEYGLPAIASGEAAYLVAKLPGLAMIGVLSEHDGRHWQQTQIKPPGGMIDATVDCRWPELMSGYFQRQIAAANKSTNVEWR